MTFLFDYYICHYSDERIRSSTIFFDELEYSVKSS